MTLPHPHPGQVYVQVTPLVAGTLTLPDWAFLAPVDRSAKHMVPCMCFLVEHPTLRQTLDGSSQTKSRLMFDLGLRGKAEDYIPQIQAHITNRYPVTHQPSAPETLRKNGIPPETIEAVILSHVHYDHHGDPQQFPNATFLVGEGSMNVVEQGLPGRGSHSHFDKKLFHDVKAVELSPPEAGCTAFSPDSLSIGLPFQGDAKWGSFGPFTTALDLFGDGSTYIVPAPGHLPGHINLLCRTGPQNWTYLGGDVFHDTRLLTGEKNISTWEEDGHSYCVHIDKAEAERSIGRIQKLGAICEREGLNLEVIAAHDNVWYENHKDKCMR